MKNKTFYLTLLLFASLIFASCAGSRGYTYSSHKKGYGCPATSGYLGQPFEKDNKV